jgi:hypothetical protein
MFNFIKRLFGGKVDEPAAVDPISTEVVTLPVDFEPEAIKPQRTKNAQGQFLADDPRTEHNEAWVGGVSPAKKPRRPRNRKPAAKPLTSEGNTKGGNGAVKQPNPNAKKPPAPKPKK